MGTRGRERGESLGGSCTSACRVCLYLSVCLVVGVCLCRRTSDMVSYVCGGGGGGRGGGADRH